MSSISADTFDLKRRAHQPGLDNIHFFDADYREGRDTYRGFIYSYRTGEYQAFIRHKKGIGETRRLLPRKMAFAMYLHLKKLGKVP